MGSIGGQRIDSVKMKKVDAVKPFKSKAMTKTPIQETYPFLNRVRQFESAPRHHRNTWGLATQCHSTEAMTIWVRNIPACESLLGILNVAREDQQSMSTTTEQYEISTQTSQ